MAFNNYDPEKVIVTWNGIIIDGFADGTFFSVSMNEAAFNLTKGADRESTRTKSNNLSAQATATLMQTSSANALLYAAHALDLVTGTNNGPLLVEDILNGETLFSANAWIMQYPDVEFGKESSTREWNFEIDEIIPTGNVLSA